MGRFLKSDSSLSRILSRFHLRKGTLQLMQTCPMSQPRKGPLYWPLSWPTSTQKGMGLFLVPLSREAYVLTCLSSSMIICYENFASFGERKEVYSSPVIILNSANWTVNLSTFQEATEKTRRCCYTIQVSVGIFDVVFSCRKQKLKNSLFVF